MTGVEWAQPRTTPGKPPVIFTPDIIDQLDARPGWWALVKRGHTNSGAAYAWAKNRPEYQVRTESKPDGTFDLYARHI